MKHLTSRAAVAFALATAATTASANDLYWQGGTGDFGDANYYDATAVPPAPNVAPGSGNHVLFIGENGIINHTTGDVSLFRVRVGHASTAGGTEGLPGPATANITGGTVATRSNNSISANSGIIVGADEDGTLNIDAATVNVTRLVTVGFGSNTAKSGNLNLTNGGTLSIAAGNLAIGDAPNGGTGMPGHVTVGGGTLSVAEAGADMVVGVLGSSTYSQSGGTVTIADATFVGRRNADNSSFTLSGGTFTTGGGFTVADNGSATIGSPDNVTVTLSGGTLNINNNFNVAVANGTTGVIGADGTTLNISGTADVNVGFNANSDGNVFLGRGTSTNTTFNMTGGTLDVAQHFLMGTGNQQTAGDPHTVTIPTNIVGNHSAGAITTGDNFVLADAGGRSTYNLSGTGAVNAGGIVIVGRQLATGTLNQTGGSMTAAIGVRVGDAFSTDATLFGTGVYNISGGSLTANIPAGHTTDALAIAPAGTGTFHVTGGDATIHVNGNMSVSSAAGAVGTLAYTFESGESLSIINVTGTATFALNSILSLDLNGTTPSQTSYDLLTAADVIDNGLTLSFPAGWNYRIVTGGNGEILQAFAASTHFPGDTNNDGVVDLTDLNNVLNNFGASGTNPGDDNGDSVVDLTDLNNVLNNFGATHAAGALASVPEPATLSLVAIGATTLLTRRRRSR